MSGGQPSRDLNKAEIKKVKDGAMRKPQQGPKAKRAAQAEKLLENKVCPMDEPPEGEGYLEDGEGVQLESPKACGGRGLPQDLDDPPMSKETGTWRISTNLLLHIANVFSCDTG